MLSVVHKYNIIFPFMVLLILSVKLNLLKLEVFASHSSRKLFCNFFLGIILSLAIMR